jgi:hypothetical protein
VAIEDVRAEVVLGLAQMSVHRPACLFGIAVADRVEDVAMVIDGMDADFGVRRGLPARLDELLSKWLEQGGDERVGGRVQYRLVEGDVRGGGVPPVAGPTDADNPRITGCPRR